MTPGEALELGRAAFEREAWSDACRHLGAADRQAAIDPEDLDRLATAAYLVGEDAASIDARTRAHQGFLERGETIRAARSAFWQAFVLLDNPGLQSQAGGWLARVRRLLDECPDECAEEGFWLCATAFQRAAGGDIPAALAAFRQAAGIGARAKDPDLLALARQGEGRALLRLEKSAEGFAMLDEVMVGVTCGEVAPMVAGIVYCSVIGACHDRMDLRRAQEWTTALAGWCDAHPDMVPFRGQCLVRRSELLQLHGSWRQASDEAQRAAERLAVPPGQPEAGAAYYQQGELYRLQGEFDRAEDAYRLAARAGRKPEPGLALLRLAQGQTDAAAASIRRVLQEARDPRARTHALRAFVEIMLAAGDLNAAGEGASELARSADELDAPLLRAAAAQASGAVALARGQLDAAADALRSAWTWWSGIDAPYEIARVRALLGLAYREMGDRDGAQLEVDAAQEVFERLGAAPDAARVAAPQPIAAPKASDLLTGRELEVLRLIATGKTNRMIAAELIISEKTVARHVSNIFTKLDLPSRSAATAYAYSHKLV